MISPDHEKKLEQAIHQALRESPPRPAPSTLESRVQAEIARRSALPWWRRSFVAWPMAARIGFVVVIAGAVKGLLMATVWAMTEFDAAKFKAALAPGMRMLEASGALLRTGGETCAAVIGTIPPLWLYGGATVVVGLYVTLFGLGAAAYRTLYANR
jgi:hypothetical protein